MWSSGNYAKVAWFTVPLAELLEVTFTEADAENLPFKDESFDFVLSAIGVMFAPNQEKAAGERFILHIWVATASFHIARSLRRFYAH